MPKTLVIQLDPPSGAETPEGAPVWGKSQFWMKQITKSVQLAGKEIMVSPTFYTTCYIYMYTYFPLSISNHVAEDSTIFHSSHQHELPQEPGVQAF